VAISHKLQERKPNFAQVTMMKTKICTNYSDENLNNCTNYKDANLSNLYDMATLRTKIKVFEIT
jgi:hypothetical protein